MQPGDRVRAKRNDVRVPVGAVGIVARLHEETGYPVALFRFDGTPPAERRVVAMLPSQVTVMDEPASVAPAKERDVTHQGSVRLSENPREVKVNPESPRPAVARPRYQWRTFDPRPMFVTVTKSGLRLSAAADRYLAAADRVVLLYDPDNRAFAMQPTKIETDRAFKLARQGSGTEVRSRLFVELIELEGVGAGRGRYPARWDEQERALVVTGVTFREPTA